MIKQITGHADFRILQEYLHDDEDATGQVAAELANLDFGFGDAAPGEMLEKEVGAEVHNLAIERRRRG